VRSKTLGRRAVEVQQLLVLCERALFDVVFAARGRPPPVGARCAPRRFASWCAKHTVRCLRVTHLAPGGAKAGRFEPAKEKIQIKKLPSKKSSLLSERARVLRGRATASEALLWQSLSGGKLGVVFRRQEPLLGRFIGDFVAPSCRLAVGVDGGWHSDRRAADERRDRALARAGYRVLRLDEKLVRERLAEAVALIRAAVRG